MIKVITGIRRCGKSYLLFQLFYKYLISRHTRKDHIIRLALDDRANKDYRDPDQLYNYIKGKITDNEMYYVLLDEVQYVPEFEDVLNSMLHVPNADVYVTGSNAKFLSKDIITEFRGRGDQIPMYPLSYSEFAGAYEGRSDLRLREYMLFGGLPYILKCRSREQKMKYLEDAFIVDKAFRYDVKGKKYIDTPLKYYFTEIGLCNARIGFRQDEETHIMENVIFNELKFRGFHVDVGTVTISEKNGNGNYVRKQTEVDFVCSRADQKYYIQSAL